MAKTRAEHIRVMAAGERPASVLPFAPTNGEEKAVINRYGVAGSVIGNAENMMLFLAGVFEGRMRFASDLGSYDRKALSKVLFDFVP
jgi:hypothetical protein